jgi:N6-adenosine-specific RNA methylase IME4
MSTPFPDKKYQVIYADPPWSYMDKRDKPGPSGNTGGSALRQYPTMSISDIKALPVGDIADEPCILFMWATWPLMIHWNDVIEAWGFKYKTLGFDWIKQYPKSGKLCIGAGSYTRSNSEVCLIGVKGKAASMIVDRSICNVQPASRGEHSKKPELFRDLIVQLVGDRPRIELFARNSSHGWDSWGNETTKFDHPADCDSIDSESEALPSLFEF